MKILAVSDIEESSLYEHYRPGKLKQYDLILACGDLKVHYLEFLVTMARCPLLYVHGNHDERFQHEPEGCTCIDDRLYVHQGVRIVGLGGSYRYRQGQYMYTEKQMDHRIRKLGWPLWKHKGFDILVTHAPPYGVGDLDTIPHRGFECFLGLMDRYEPKYHVHGHVHLNYEHNIPRRMQYGHTEVINAFGFTEIDYEPETPEKDREEAE